VPSRLTGTLALLAAVAVWGTTYVVAKEILQHVGPFTLAVARFAISLIVLVPIATKLGRERLPRFGRSSLILGLFGVALYFGLQNLGLTMTSAASAALVAAVIPALTAGLSYVLLGERLSRLQVAGVALAVLGVALVVGADLDLASPERLIGSLLIFCAAAAWAVYTIEGRRVLHGISPAVVSVQTTAVGLVILLPFAAWEVVRDGMPTSLGAGDVAGILYLGVVASAVTFILWNSGLRAMGSTTSTVMLNLIPVVGLATSFVAGESISVLQLAGGAIVLGGVMLTLQSGRRAPRPVERTAEAVEAAEAVEVVEATP
jgi:drug/metabolite transporter (DMT)-like permease